MSVVGFAAKVFDADGGVSVTPMGVFWFGGFNAVCIPDSDDSGLWFGCDCDWRIDVEEGDACDVETFGRLFALSWI